LPGPVHSRREGSGSARRLNRGEGTHSRAARKASGISPSEAEPPGKEEFESGKANGGGGQPEIDG